MFIDAQLFHTRAAPARKLARAESLGLVKGLLESYQVAYKPDDTNYELVCPATDIGHCWHYIIEPCSEPCCWCNRDPEGDSNKIPVFENGVWNWIYQN